MPKKVEAILIDVDGCLLPTNGDVSPEFYQGLARVAQWVQMANQGNFPPIGFCTGRDRNYVEALSFAVGLPNSWSVIESGVVLFNPTTKEMLLNPALTAEVKEAFEEITRKKVPQILEKYPGLFLYPGNRINIAFERKYGFNLSIEECFLSVKEDLADIIGLNLVTVHHSNIAIDISPAGIDKASGVGFLSKQTKIKPLRMLGIGDSRGDFPLLQLVGQVGCPANSSNECKDLILEKKGYISPSTYANGVADVISHFCHKG